jgi:hypothetical protein
MVERTIVSTITIPVAADIPPMNTSMASYCWCSDMSRVNAKESASTIPFEKFKMPLNGPVRPSRQVESH